MPDVIVVEFEKNAREVVRVTLTAYKGHQLLDVRQFARGKNGESIPTQKGVSINRDLATVLLTGVQKAVELIAHAK